MHFQAWNGTQLVNIYPPQLQGHCRNGIYICCSGDQGHGGECGLHLWIWRGPDPIPHHDVLMQTIRHDVPHVNGNGTHV